MEDPETRRARLKAMREQAEGVSQSAPIPNNSTSKLANPFEEAAPTSDAHTPRFNYYSNPAAGFLHTKRKEPAPPVNLHPSGNPYPSPRNWRPDFCPPAPAPPLMDPEVQGFGSPIPMYNPQHPGFGPPPPALQPQQRYSERSWPVKRPNYGGPGREAGRGAGRGLGFGGRGLGSGSGGFARNESNQARGRGGRGGRGGQGRGSNGPVSARDRPDLFYNKSMVEDPWRHLM